MLYFVELDHTPQQCPGVATEIRDRVLRMSQSMDQVLQSRGCAFRGGWVGKSSHKTFAVIDAPDAHSLDYALVDLGLAVWNTASIYPVITIEEAVEGLKAI